MRNFDLSPLMRQWIGFDKLANALQNAGESQSFPPYNIEKSDDNHYRITLALAGFRQEDFELHLEGTRLSVKGTPEQPKEEKKWLHQGLMNQPFSLSFTLAENMEVSGATFVNGFRRRYRGTPIGTVPYEFQTVSDHDGGDIRRIDDEAVRQSFSAHKRDIFGTSVEIHLCVNV